VKQEKEEKSTRRGKKGTTMTRLKLATVQNGAKLVATRAKRSFKLKMIWGMPPRSRGYATLIAELVQSDCECQVQLTRRSGQVSFRNIRSYFRPQ